MGQNLTYRPLLGSRLNMAHPMARNMALCMLFNEQGSRAMDLSPYQANGRLSGFGSPAKRHIGGLDFVAATPSYVEIPASFTQLNFTSEDFSIIVRYKPDNITFFHYFLERSLYPGGGYYFRGNNIARLEFYTYQGDVSQTSCTTPVFVNGEWATYGFSRTGASVRLYKNGVDVTNVAGDHIDPASVDTDAMIGISRNKVSYPLDGKMEFHYIYRNRALSELEHKAIYLDPYSPFGYPMFI